IRVHSCTDGLGIAEAGAACVALWRSEVTLPRFERQRAALRDVAARNAGKAAFVCVIGAGTPALDEPLRKASIEMMNELSPLLACVACVIEGSGFRGAVTRSILSGMSLLVSKSLANIKFSAQIGEAAAWVTRHSSAASAPAILEAHAML